LLLLNQAIEGAFTMHQQCIANTWPWLHKAV